MMAKNIAKFLGIAILIVIAGGLILLGIQYFRYRTSPEYRTLVNVKNLEKKYAEDPYGGETPEETLRLFIDALKKGDTELAAKYFILDKQQEWREDLAKIKEKDLLDEMVIDLENVERGNDLNNDTARFTVANKNNEVITIIQIAKSTNGKWKILDF